MAQEFNTHGGYFAPAGYFRINEGGSHEENPNGGVQIGMDGQGIPNMLEQEESVYNDYVYSDNITAKPDVLKRFFIPYKYGGKLYSEIADALIEEAEERPLDHTSNNGVRAMLTRLADAQETQKQEEEQAKLEEELANMTPEQIAELEQMLAQDEAMQQQPTPQEAVAPEVMMQPEMQPAMMAYGGLLHAYEDGTPGEIVQTVPLDYVPETGNVKGGARTYAEQPFGPAPDTGHITQYVDTRTPVRKAIDNIVDSTPSLRHAKEGFDRFDDTLLGGVSQLLVPSSDGVAAAGFLGGLGKIIGGGRGLAKVAKGEAKLGKVSERVGEAIGKYGDDLVASTSEATKAASNTASKSEAALQTIRGSRNASKAERAAAESQIRDIAKEIENTTNPEEIKVYNELLDEMVAKFDKADSALKNSLFESIGKRFSAIRDKAEKGVSSLNEKVAKAVFDGSEKTDKAKKTATKINPKVKTALKWGAGLTAGSVLGSAVAKGVDIAQSSNSEEFAVDPFAYGGPIHRFDEETKMDRSGGVTGALQIQPAGSPLWIDLAHQGYYGPYAPGQSPQELAAAGNTGGSNPPAKRAGASRPVAPAKTRGPIDKIAADTTLIGPHKDWRVDTKKYKRVPFTKDYIPDVDYSTNGLANPNYTSPTVNSGAEQGGADVPIYSTLLEYAHPLYSLFSAGVNMFQQPDKYKFQRARPRIPYMSIPSIIDPEYRAIDVNRTVNDISAAGAGNVRAALDSGAGPSVGTLLTALDNQMTSNMGNARESVAQFNNNAYNTVVGQRNQNAFQRAQLMFELAMARANAEAAADTQNIAMDMREQMMNNQAEQHWADAVGAPLDAFTGDLSKMGLRNQNLNAANAASVFGYWRAPDGTVWYNGQPVVNQSSCGGTLLKAIK